MARSLGGSLGMRYFEADDHLSVLYCFKTSEDMHRRVPHHCYALGSMQVSQLGQGNRQLSGRVTSGRHKKVKLSAFELQFESEGSAARKPLVLGSESASDADRWLRSLQQRIELATSRHLHIEMDTQGNRAALDVESHEVEVTAGRRSDGTVGIVFDVNDDGDPFAYEIKPDVRLEPPMLVGDQILSLNGKTKHSVRAIVDELKATRETCPQVTFRVRRTPRMDHVRVKQRLGVTLGNLHWSPIGVEVLTVEPGSKAAQRGIEPGHAIVSVNGDACLSYRHAEELLSAAIGRDDGVDLIVAEEPEDARWPARKQFVPRSPSRAPATVTADTSSESDPVDLS